MKQKILKQGILLKFNLRFVILIITSIILLVTAKYLEHSIYVKQPAASLGVDLVNTLYTYDSLDNLVRDQSKKLSMIMDSHLVTRFSLETNRNRIQYTYYRLGKGTICPIIHKSKPGYIEFSIAINGEDDGILRGIWYKETNGKISGISEAILYPFPVSNKK